MDCSLPGSSVHGISRARILEWIPFPFPGDLPRPGIEPTAPVAGKCYRCSNSLFVDEGQGGQVSYPSSDTLVSGGPNLSRS